MMTSKDIALTRLIENWAADQVRLHKRVCRDSGCAGKSMIWWVTRHPATHRDIANKVAVDFVLSRQCCELLELGLVDGPSAASRADWSFSYPLDEGFVKNFSDGFRKGVRKLFWLPGEKKLYRSRTSEERAQLLGRAFLPADTSGSPEVIPSEVRKSFPEVPARKNRSAPAVPSRKVPADFGSVVDALTRKG